MFKVKETTVPGVGKKYELYLTKNRSIAVVIQSGGRRQVLSRDDPDDDYEKLFAAGDRLMAIGIDEAHEKLNALLQDV